MDILPHREARYNEIPPSNPHKLALMPTYHLHDTKQNDKVRIKKQHTPTQSNISTNWLTTTTPSNTPA